MKGDLQNMGPEKRKSVDDVSWDSCPYDSERPTTVKGSYDPIKEPIGPPLRPFEPDVERVKELANAAILAMENGQEVNLRWLDELHDICRLHNLFGVRERMIMHAADGTAYVI